MMFSGKKWAKLFFFIGLSLFPCLLSASLLKPVPSEAHLLEACSPEQDPAQAKLCRTLFIYEYAQKRQHDLRVLLQQNIFSIQTYDYLWSEYQRTKSCIEIHRYLVAKACDVLNCPAAPSSPFQGQRPDSSLIEPPPIFALQEPIN
ncbi:hypothetical protein HV127_21895 [Klebsiella sp. RHBSTW-00215]|uniref:hypothetical protein n=1 Tax=Klebsiella sp. RHBSTW-00215 TaxID=2742640 RepID=UPI0015F5E702|nr:hypothetical protein [Klebsiella sp. RHBSTW-00215]MBA7933872.1 hypothetical protein [Klebsiella sp. RHBSTW-00215]